MDSDLHPVYKQAKLAQTILKGCRWTALVLAIAIFAVPMTTIPPYLARESAKATRTTLETLGAPAMGRLDERKQVSPENIDRLVAEQYNTSLGIIRFFTGFGSFMVFLVFWYIFARPMLAEAQKQAELVEQSKTEFEKAMLEESLETPTEQA